MLNQRRAFLRGLGVTGLSLLTVGCETNPEGPGVAKPGETPAPGSTTPLPPPGGGPVGPGGVQKKTGPKAKADASVEPS
jgi:hypothetical protein